MITHLIVQIVVGGLLFGTLFLVMIFWLYRQHFHDLEDSYSSNYRVLEVLQIKALHDTRTQHERRLAPAKLTQSRGVVTGGALSEVRS